MKNLTQETIQDLTYSEYYQRGFKYYQEGRVLDFKEADSIIKATVLGSEKYKVEVDLDLLEYECNCPAFHGKQPCKHIVAVLLTKALGKKKAKKHKFSQVKQNKKSKRQGLITKSQTQNQDLDQLKKQIKSKIKILDYHYGDYWNYVGSQQEFSRFVISKISKLPDNKETAKFLLRLAEWLEDKQLLKYDDSDGILQDLSWEILSKAVNYLDDPKQVDLKLIFTYTIKDHEFDLGTKIIEAILANVSNKQVIEKITSKLENLLNGPDNDFTFDPQFGIWVLCSYLLEKNDPKFEQIALKVYQKDNHIRSELIKYYLKNKKYEAVVKYGWDEKDSPYIKDNLIQALEKMGDKDKLIQLYKEEINKFFNINLLKKIKGLYKQKGQAKAYKQYLNKIANKFNHDLSLQMHLKNYSQVVKILKKNYLSSFGKKEDIENYAHKLKILDPKYAKQIYKFLFAKEAAKLKSYSYYPNLIKYACELKELGCLQYLKKTNQMFKKQYPTKIKLLERFGQLVKTRL